MSPLLTRANALIAVGLLLVVLGWGSPHDAGFPEPTPLGLVAPSWFAAAAGVLGWALVAAGLFLDGLPTPRSERDWVPDDEEMDEWER